MTPSGATLTGGADGTTGGPSISNPLITNYDVFDNLVRVVQGVQTRTFVYDSLSRKTSETHPESGTTTYTYDSDGNLLTKTDA